jgi:hypothetical protein
MAWLRSQYARDQPSRTSWGEILPLPDPGRDPLFNKVYSILATLSEIEDLRDTDDLTLQNARNNGHLVFLTGHKWLGGE